MESLSRPFHKRKLPNANNFSGKNAYDGVFSGHRRKHDGPPDFTVEDYSEIFTTDSSIPVLDLSTLEEASGGLNMEIWSTKPDYGMIFGGFCDQDIAICYEEMVARDEARACAPSASHSSHDLGDLSNQPLDASKQFNMAYNKISQRSKDGLDGTTHVTQLPAVSGFTCFMNESASQPKKETKNKKSSKTKIIHPGVNSSEWNVPEKQTSQSTAEFRSKQQVESLYGERIIKTLEVDLKPSPSKVSSPSAAAEPNQEIKNQKSNITNHASVNSRKEDIHEKRTSQSAVESGSRYGQDESLSGDRNLKTFEVDLKPYPSRVSPSAVSQPNKETGNQKTYITNNIYPGVNSSKGDFHEKQTSQSAAESANRYSHVESLSGDKVINALEVDLKPSLSKGSSPPAVFEPNKEIEKQKTYMTNDIHASVNSSKGDFHEKQTSESAVESESRYVQDESLSGDRIFKASEVDLKPCPSKVSPPSAVSEPNKETDNQKSYITNDAHPSVNSNKEDIHEKQISQSAVESRSRYVQDESSPGDDILKTFEVDLKPHSSEVLSPPAASQQNTEAENQKSDITNNIQPSMNSSKEDFREKQTSQSAVESRSGYGQDESSSDDDIFKTFEVDLKPHPSKVLSPPAPSQPNKEAENQKSYITSNIHPGADSSKGDFHEKQTSQSAVESRSRYGQDESISDDRNFKKFQADLRSHPPNVSPPPAALATNSEELDVNSAAAISAAALRKAIEKAQENIRIAKESVGRKKGFSSKSFKDSLKVKAKTVNVKGGEECKEKDDKMKEKDHKHESTVVFPDFMDGEKLFGAKKVIHELHGKIPELGKNAEIPIQYPVELRESKILCSSKRVVGETESEPIENNSHEGGLHVLESLEKKLGDTESNNSTVDQKVEDEKEIRGKSDENDYEKKFCEEPFEFFVTDKQENLEQELDEKMESAVSQVEDEREVKAEEKFNNVCEVGMIKNAETCNFSIETNDLSQKEDYEIKEKENDKLDKMQVPETYEKSSIDFDDAEESKRVIGASQIVNDTEACKVYQNVSNAESSQGIDDVSRGSSSGHKLQVEDTEAIDKETTENVSLNETEDNKDECDAKYDDLANSGLTDVGFVRNDYSVETNDLSQKEDKLQVPETYENSSSDCNDEEESESVIGASQIVDDTKDACKVDQNDNNADSSQEIDDVSSGSNTGHDFQVEDTEALEKVMNENISSDETEDNEDGCDAKSDDLANFGLADVDFVQNDARSESSSDTILGMEIEVKGHKEREETVEKEDNNLQQSHEQTPEIRTKTETGTQEPDDKSGESDPHKIVEKKQNEEEKEQERIKSAVDRAIREARERAFAEVRQRVIADTQEKVTKASSDKTSAKLKLKAERAAVERATAEARQRALEKAISQKKLSEPKIQINETDQTTSAINHTNAESALRTKAKLEKHNRIMERAAKALAEKEMRDLLVLREQAERSRLAENLDADIKRWSGGKEGNLRALLSTLQYILGADSGWQPVSLTEIITTSAVKKAYRKATLCVHPDKLQQRGASIQQKYICEKVFDLLKAAWNRFNSEER
ncbi:auxilin-like protein 1 [Helianthus annuus]|uniref:Putative dnaJ domain-containing protein n=1 Tax=Helianthus annuus TaxID=4232 RepID=A0A251TYJ8_HELAN|nr:auxilin-like protein 1 [Helianthus annuus]